MLPWGGRRGGAAAPTKVDEAPFPLCEMRLPDSLLVSEQLSTLLALPPGVLGPQETRQAPDQLCALGQVKGAQCP